jgi:6,7-dimethyl-8-ribityllumazine synthase
MSVRHLEPGAGPAKVGVVAASFNEAITGPLLDGALAELERREVPEVVVVRVPGALELGVAASRLAVAGCDAVVAVGAVIEGETDHYEIVTRESARALTEVALSTGVPVANAVLAVREYSHAVARSRPGPGNKGAEAAAAACETVAMLRAIDRG